MKSGPIRSGVTGRRNRIGVMILSLVAALAMLGASAQFMRLLDVERDMDAIIREDAIWAIFQADRHMRALETSARHISQTGSVDDHPEFVRHFDILYSRVALLERGTFHLDLSQEGTLTTQAQSLAAFVFGLEDRIDALDPASPDYLAEVRMLHAEISLYPELTNRMLLDANVGMNVRRVEDRELRRGVQDQLARMMVVLVLAFIGIFVLLMVQLRQLARASQRMELLQERSRRKAVRAQAASKAKSAFLATMSHEMRTPLNGIIGSAELMSLDGLAPAHRDRVETIRASATLLRDVIDGILNFSQLERGAIELRAEPVCLSELGDVLRRAFGAQAQADGVTLQVDMPAAVVMTDPALVRQVIARLVENALKFAPQGEICVTGTQPAPGLLRVEVADEGIGIAASALPHLFREFGQIDTSFARRYGGSGLGLAICKRSVEALGGTIGVDSTEGVGSCFWFEIPASAANLPEPSGPEVARRDPLHILIAEDNAINLDVMAGHLERLGHSHASARNGKEAVDYLATGHADAVFMDMQMPVMDGVEATRVLRAQGHDLPIIAVTANALAQDRAACLAAGMNAFLPKPVTQATICQALADVLPARADPAPDTPLPFMPTPDAEPGAPPHQPETAPPEDTAPPPEAAVENGPVATSQLQDLVGALGYEMVEGFVERFDQEIEELQVNLQSAVESGDTATQDNLLHTFKGAALTLGMTSSGTLAQHLRGEVPVTLDQTRHLVVVAREDLHNCRVWLKTLVSA